MAVSRNILRLMALVCMFIDHSGIFLFNNNIIFRAIGRIAFPLYVYLLVDGFHRTRDLKKYMLRLAALFVISIVPYSLALYKVLFAPAINVCGSLLLYLFLFCILNKKEAPILAKVCVGILFVVIAEFFHFEYGWYGVCIAVVMFYFHQLDTQTAFGIIFMLGMVYGRLYSFPVQVVAAIAVFFIPYQGVFIESYRPPRSLTLINYLFYPIHLLFFALLNF